MEQRVPQKVTDRQTTGGKQGSRTKQPGLEARVRQLEVALLEQKRLNTAMVESLPGGLALFSREGRLLDIPGNPPAPGSFPVALFRRKRPGAKHTHTRTTLAQAIGRVLASGNLETIELEVNTPSGERCFQADLRRYDADSALAYIIDVTERNRETENLRIQEKKFRDVVEGSVQGIVVHRHGKVLFANQAFADIHGFRTTDEILALDSISGLAAPGERKRLRERAKARIRGESPPDAYEFKALKKDGSTIHVTSLNSRIEWEGAPAILSTIQDITQSRRAEQQLRVNERLLNAVFDNVPTAIGVKDLNARYLFANKAFGALFGVDPEAIKGKTFAETEAGGKSQIKRVTREDARLLRTGIPLELQEAPVTFPNGGQGWRHVIKIPIRDDSGKIIGLLSAIEDITKRKRAEDALRESESRMRSVMESAGDGIFTADQKGRIETINPAGARMFAFEPKEMIGRPVTMLIPSASRKKHDYGMQQVREGKMHVTGITLEAEGVRKDGNQINLEITLGEFTLEDQRKYTGIVRDTTLRKLADAKLRKSERQLRHAQEIAQVGYWERDFNTDAIEWSEETYRIFGIEPGTFQPSISSVLSLIHPDDRKMLQEGIESTVDPKQHYRAEYRIIRPDGTIRLVETRGELILGKDGSRQKLAGAILDITEKKNAEAELNRSRTLLEKVINSIPSPVSLKDRDGRYLIVNDSLTGQYGVEKEAYIGKTINDLPFIEPERAGLIEAADRHVLSRGERTEIPRILVRLPDNKTGWRRLIKVPIHDEDGKVSGLVGIAIDITDHVLAEQAITEAAKKYQSLFDRANDAIFIVDAETLEVLDANNNAVKHLGYSKSELRKSTVLDFVAPEALERTKHIPEKIKEEGSAVFESIQVHKSGRKIPVEIRSALIEIEGQKMIQSVVRDLSDRKRYEEALRVSEAKMRHLIESANAVVWEMDSASLQFTYVSPQATRITGYDPKAWNNFDFWAGIVHPDDRDRTVRRYMESVDKGSGHAIEYRIRKNTGEIVWVRDIVSVGLAETNRFSLQGVIIDITEHKVIEEKLNDVIENSPIILWAIDASGTIVLTKGKGLLAQSFTKDQLLGRSIFEVYRDYPDFLANVRRALTGESFTAENETYGRVFVKTFLPTFDPEGNITGVSGVSTDITEKKKAESELRESEMRYRSAVEAMTEGIVALDAEGRITACNSSAERILGLSKEEMEGRKPVDPRWRAIHTDGSEFPGEAHPSMVSLRAGKPVSNITMGVHHPDGKLVWILINAQPIFQNDLNTPSGVVTTFTDITQHMEAEEERIRLITAVEQTAEAVVITDSRGEIQYVNSAFERITGYAREEAIGKNPRILKSGRHDHGFYQSMWRTITRGENWSGELVNRRKDGSFYEEEMNISPIRDSLGSIVNFIAVKRDITERKKAEERIRLQEQQLIQADKMASLGILVSGVAHEINNPNSFITFNAPILNRIWSDAMPILKQYQNQAGEFTLASLPFDKAAEAVPKLLSGIANGATRIKKIVGTLKEFASQDLSGEFRPVDLNAVLESAVNLLANEIGRRTGHFKVTYGENLPPVMGDFQKIEQVVINLITNACQALPDRNRAIRIATGFDTETGMVRMTLVDEGVGISQENLGKIMDPFFTTKRDVGGTGLGLSVSYSIMEEHNGNLEFFSTEGEGTTVVICLPVIH